MEWTDTPGMSKVFREMKAMKLNWKSEIEAHVLMDVIKGNWDTDLPFDEGTAIDLIFDAQTDFSERLRPQDIIPLVALAMELESARHTLVIETVGDIHRVANEWRRKLPSNQTTQSGEVAK